MKGKQQYHLPCGKFLQRKRWRDISTVIVTDRWSDERGHHSSVTTRVWSPSHKYRSVERRITTTYGCSWLTDYPNIRREKAAA